MGKAIFGFYSPEKFSSGWMIFTSILGIVLGLVMLFYPGGTMTLMKAGFKIFQILLSIFIVYYAISHAIQHFKAEQVWNAVAFLLLGAIFTALIWWMDVRFLYYVIAFFLFVTGISSLIGAWTMPTGKFFLALLGLIDILFGVVIIRYPVVLALIIAWYVLFYGVSRLLLALELRKALSH